MPTRRVAALQPMHTARRSDNSSLASLAMYCEEAVRVLVVTQLLGQDNELPATAGAATPPKAS